MTSENLSSTFAFQIKQIAEKRPDLKILTFDYGDYPAEVLTYRDIYANGCKMSKLLRENGIGNGEKFAVMMANHPEFVYAFFAASVTGAVAVPIDPRSRGEKLAHQINNSNCKGIIVTPNLLEVYEEVRQDIKACKVLGVVYKDVYETEVNRDYPVLNEILAGPEVGFPEDSKTDAATPFEVIYTSGTTGNPKGVIVNEDRLASYVLFAKMVWQYQETDILYTGLSLTHGNAQAVNLIPSLYLGIPAVFSHKFTKSRIWDICRKYGCTTFSLLGGMMTGIYSEPVKDNDNDNPVRLVISAGTPPAMWKDFEDRFNVKIHEWYGAVEGGFAHNPPGVGPIGSFGKPLPGVMEMKVVREDDTECAPFEKGELIGRMLRGNTEVVYYGNKQASEDKTRGGWLRTGDICHTDENGWFFFDFRVGGGLRRQGDFIQPEFVEKIIAEHQDVSDVCVYGVPAATGAPGESDIVAAVVPFVGKTIDLESLIEACKAKLERNAVPTYIQIVEEIPKTASEKNLTRLLKEAFAPNKENVYKID